MISIHTGRNGALQTKSLIQQAVRAPRATQLLVRAMHADNARKRELANYQS
jgi:hypothetical protein